MILLALKLLVLLIVPISGNLWDNIFSQMSAGTPIIVKTSLHFNFPLQYQEVQFDGQFDYNIDYQIATILISKSLLFLQIPLIQIQIDLQTSLIIVEQPTGCSNYKLQLFENQDDPNKERVQQILKNPFSKIFLLNIMFKYTGEENGLKKFIYQPDLLIPNTQQNLKQQDIIVLVNDKGIIQDIYTKQGQERQNIKFELKSRVKKRIYCKEEVQTINRQQLQRIVQDFLKDQKELPIP